MARRVTEEESRGIYVIPKTYEELLEASRAIDLRDNHTITRLPNGYDRIEPIDSTKLFKKIRI